MKFILSKSDIVFIIIVTIISGLAVYGYADHHFKKNTFHTYQITGRVVELRLITTFPDEGLYIGFDNGGYRFVDINYWWSYANLQMFNLDQNVTITYERNHYNNLRVLHIEVTDD